MQIITQKNQKELKEHGNYAFPVNISIEKIESYEKGLFLWHWHPEVELTLILSGEIEYQVEDNTYMLSAGDGIFCNSNSLHSGHMKDGKECTYLSVTFHPRFLYGYENSILSTKYVNFITFNELWASLVLKTSVLWQKEVLENIRQIYELSQNEPADFELRVHMLLLNIWQKFYQYFSLQPDHAPKPKQHLQRLRDILLFIEEHYNQELSLEDVAKSANICKSECCRFFKKHMGMTIFDYILYLKIQNSLPLLKKTDSITEVASMVGFSSPSYYSQIFKRYMKCTPMEYKNKTPKFNNIPYI
ncbi:MAG: helix-turn-helix transcriptional regulator [Tyzzerella sp.]|nr:helix-turn-helix transcriptional regulator [Tyzzerella sp.]